MIARRAILAGGLVLAAAPAFALDSGVAQGRYRDDDRDLGFAHAIALLQDNAEGLLDRPNQMRVLLSDVEAPPAVLYGVVFPPVYAMARAGTVKGVLLEFDPADRNALHVTILARPGNPGVSLTNVSLSNSQGLWKRLDASATRIVGELNDDASEHLAASFSAPVFTDPVQADLKGPAAQASEQVAVLIARAQALARGDMAAAAALSTEASAADLGAMPPDQMKAFAKQIPGMLRQLKAAKRVVVRRETAAILVGDGSWFSLVRVGGAWKAAD